MLKGLLLFQCLLRYKHSNNNNPYKIIYYYYYNYFNNNNNYPKTNNVNSIPFSSIPENSVPLEPDKKVSEPEKTVSLNDKTVSESDKTVSEADKTVPVTGSQSDESGTLDVTKLKRATFGYCYYYIFVLIQISFVILSAFVIVHF